MFGRLDGDVSQVTPIVGQSPARTSDALLPHSSFDISWTGKEPIPIDMSGYLPACTFNGRYQPTLGQRRFVAFSAFSWVVDVLGLPAETTALEETSAAHYCPLNSKSERHADWMYMAKIC